MEAQDPLTGALCRRVAALCDSVTALLPTGDERELVIRVREGLDEPLRIAVAGRVSSGKSTLVNALLAQRVAPTDVSECTRYVTTYRYGVPERVEIVERGGARHRQALLPDGSLPRSPGEATGDIARLEVFLANDALRDLVLIDTPGLGSLDDERRAGTAALLGLDGDSRAAVADADALVFVLTASLRSDEAELLRSVHEVLVGSTASPLSTLAVLNKADLLEGDGDPLEAAAALAERFTSALRSAVTDVQPLVSLIAETVLTGRFGERHAGTLRSLAALAEPQRRALLLSADRFATGECPVSARDRADLLAALGLHGVRVAVGLVDEGTASATDLLDALRSLSGFDRLRTRLLDGFSHDADALKANGALAALERMTYAMTDPERHGARVALHDGIDAVRTDPSMHRLDELRAANRIATGEIELPAGLDSDALRLVSIAPAAVRLGLPPGAANDEVQAAALAQAATWKRYRNDGRASPDQQWAADVMTRTCERLWLELSRAQSTASR